MPPLKGVPIKIGDRSKNRYLRYTHRALEKLEIDTGMTIDQHGRRLSSGSAVSLSATIWAGLLHAEPDLTREQVGDMLDTKRYKEYGEAITKAIGSAFGNDEPEGNGEGEPPAP